MSRAGSAGIPVLPCKSFHNNQVCSISDPLAARDSSDALDFFSESRFPANERRRFIDFSRLWAECESERVEESGGLSSVRMHIGVHSPG